MLLTDLLLLLTLAAALFYYLWQRSRWHTARLRMRGILDGMSLPVACIGRGFRVLHANERFAVLFDIPSGKLIGQLLDQLGDRAFVAALHRPLVDAFGGTSSAFELKLGADERPYRVACSVSPVDGARVAIITLDEIGQSHQAVADQQQHQREMAHVSRLATMGELAAKLAHELNQPLCAITGYTRASLRMMRAGHWDQDELIEAMEDASQQAERAADIIRGMRNFLRKDVSDRAELDMAEAVHVAVRLVEAEARSRRVKIGLQLAYPLPSVLANRIEIEQVLFNLMLNAIEAIESSSSAEGPPKWVTITTRETEEGEVETQVTDSGSGFVEGTAAHLFDPFFSTKQEGMGMGLSICRTIIESHGGRLRASNNPQRGATFSFTLPSMQTGESATDD